MKKIISIVLLLLVVLVGGLILGPSMVDWNKYKPEILSQLRQLTGHEYGIAGNIELAIVPQPRVKIDGLSVGMPQNLGGSTIASLERVAVNVELMPLLQKQIVIKSVELVKPVFNLGVRADGTAVWMTPELQAKLEAGKAVTAEPRRAAGDALAHAIALHQIRIKEGSFSYSDEAKKTSTALDQINLDIEGGSLFGPYKIEGQVAYKNQPVTVAIKTTKVADFNAAIPVQAQFNLPSGGTVLTYSGVVATKPSLEVQGEAAFKTNSLAEVIKALTGTINPVLAKPVKVTGILTYNAAGADYKNVALNIAGSEATGSVMIKNIAKDAGAPMDVVLSLKSDQLSLDDLWPSPANTAPQKKQGYLPENIALPTDMRAKADLAVKSAVYKGATFSDVSVTAVLAEKGVTGAIKAVTPGQGKIDATYNLAAGSVSRNDKGGVLFSDLNLGLEGTAQAAVPQALVKPFVAPDALKSVGTLLSTPASTVFKFSVAPAFANIHSANINILDTDLTLSGSYKPGINAGRDLLTVNVSAPVIDGDAWGKRLQPPDQAATQAAPAQAGKDLDIAGMAKKLSLPMDLDATVSVGSLTLYEQTYDKVAFKGRLIGNKLSIDTAGLEATGGNSLTLAGSIGDVSALKDVDLTVKGKTPDTLKMLQGFKVDTKNMPAGIGPSEMLAEFKGQPDNLNFVANIKALKGTVDASGALDDLMSKPKVSNLTLRAKHPNYVELARLISPDFKSNVAMDKNMDIYTSMTRVGTTYTLKDFQATLGPSTISGQLSYDTGGARPKLTANLSAGDLALSDIMGVEKKNKGTVQARNVSADNVRWSRNAINADILRQYDADVKITAKSLSWMTWRADNAVIEAKLDNGTLNIARLNGGLYGGTLNAHGTVVAGADSKSPLNVSATAKLTEVSLESFVSSFSGSELIKARGALNLDSNITTSGISPAALVFGLKGKATTTGKDLVIDGFDLARVSRTLVQPSSSAKENLMSLLDTSMAGGQTAFSTMDGAFTITEGVIHFDKMELTGDAATVNMAGNVNLPLWTVDLESTIKLAEPADAPPLKTSFRGPLDNPGKTFGRNALDNYVGNQLQNFIGNAVKDKLQDKGLLPEGTPTPENAGDLIQNIIQQKITPKADTGATVTPAQPLSPVKVPPAPASAPTPAPAPAAAPAAAPVSTSVTPTAPAAAVEPAAAPPAPAASVDAPATAPASATPAPATAPTAAPTTQPVTTQPATAPASLEGAGAGAEGAASEGAVPEGTATEGNAAPDQAAPPDPIGNLIEGLTTDQ